MTSPSYSRAQLVDRALRVLNVTPVGQSHEQDDIDVVDALVEPLIARLNAEGITSRTDDEGNIIQLDDPDAIPATHFIDVAILLADAAKGEFGIPDLPGYSPTQSEMRLRTVISVGPTQEEYETTETDLDTDTTTVVTRRRNATLVGEYM